MEFRVLGPLEVVRDGVSLDVRGTKRRVLLALLVLRANEVVGTDWLVHEVWGEHRPANASGALYSHVSRLRKDIGDVLVTKPWGYVLRVEPEAVDFRRFNSLVADASSLPARERAAKLAEALALWRGPALADLADEPALALEAERLDELRLAAVEQRVDAELELGSHNALIPELEALVAAHPLRERMRGQLILALYRAGRQAEALEVYRETRRVLVDELGIEPTPELRELEQAILRQDESLAAPASVRDEPVAAGAPEPRRRRGLLFAALLVPVFAAGLAFAAIVLTRDAASPVAGETSTSVIAALEPVTVTTQATTTLAPERTTTHERKPKPKPEPKPEPKPRTVVRTATVAPTTQQRPPTTHRATTTTHITKATTTSPKTTASPHWTWVLADPFDDDGLTSLMWHPSSGGNGFSSGTNGGRLEMQVREDAEVPAASFYEEPCTMIDDFEARVDFQLLDWPAADGVEVVLGVHVGGPPVDDEVWTAGRTGARSGAVGGESYVGIVHSSSSSVGTEDLSGTLRLVRSKGVLTAYYRGKRDWVRIASGRESRFASVVLGVRANADAFGRRTARIAFDNFRATGDNVFCPGPYRATRKLVTP